MTIRSALSSKLTVKSSQKISSTEGGLDASGVTLENDDRFGISVASVGDFDGDTVTDICVGAIWDDDGTSGFARIATAEPCTCCS